MSVYLPVKECEEGGSKLQVNISDEPSAHVLTDCHKPHVRCTNLFNGVDLIK